eukprot:257327-Prymnesium_polylepis.2
MLRFSPRYPSKGKLSLQIPGSLLEQKLTFHDHVALFSSECSPGAADAANEMHLAFKEILLTNIGPPRRRRSTHQQPPRSSVLGLLPSRRRPSNEPRSPTRRTSDECPTREDADAPSSTSGARVHSGGASSTSGARGHSGGSSELDSTLTHFLLCDAWDSNLPPPPKPRLFDPGESRGVGRPEPGNISGTCGRGVGA